jgi:DNA-binding transcriptional LysR family regulator
MDKLISMRAFTKVIALGSFAKAAHHMHISRSAVSKYVNDLEAQLGVQLIKRTTRSASLTDSGQRYYERCLAILADIDEADQTVSDQQVNPRGTLKINAPMSFGTMHLGKAVAAFMERYPDLHIHLILSDQQVNTIQEGFDVTIRIANLSDSSLVARRIVPAPRILCASPEYLKRRGIPMHPNDLLQHDCLSYDYLGTGAQWKLTGEDGDHWFHVPSKLLANNGEVLCDAAVSGRGIVLLPTFIIGADLRSGRLKRILAHYRAPELFICALYPPTRHLSVKVRVLIDYLVEQFGTRSGWDIVAEVEGEFRP